MAYHRQGRARPACVLEFLDTHLEAKEKRRGLVLLRKSKRLIQALSNKNVLSNIILNIKKYYIYYILY